MITVTSKKEAWELVTKLNGFDVYELDKAASANAGYPVYRAESFNYYVCDLSTRLEVNTSQGSFNIYISEEINEEVQPDEDCQITLTKKEADYIPYILNGYKAIRCKRGTLSEELKDILDNVSRKVFYAYLDKYEDKL